MDEQLNPAAPQPPPQTPPPLTVVLPPRRVYETDGRDRAALALSLGLGVLMADLLLSLNTGLPGLGITLLVLAWEGVMLWYAGGASPLRLLRRGPGLWLTAAVVLLAADFALFSNQWFWLFNVCALLCLMTVQMMELFGRPRHPWWRPSMLVERGGLLLDGLLDRLPATYHTLKSKRAKKRRVWYVLGGLLVTIPLLGVVLPLLMSADAAFSLLAGQAVTLFMDNLGALPGRILLGTVFAPLLFGLLYLLRHPERKAETNAKSAPEGWTADPAIFATVLTVLNALYLLFVGVQFRALFGGADYLAATGLSHAEYARSGFFQLVWVSAINLVVVLAAVQLSTRAGRLWRAVQVLATTMVALSGVMLVSAAWRMSLYVGMYGLSFKRFLTYWGMLMLAVFFGAAVLKIWREPFAFFRVLFAASLAGWILLNAANADALVSRYNVWLYQSGNSAVIDLDYLGDLSYDALSALEQLDGALVVGTGKATGSDAEYPLEALIRDGRDAARRDAASWRSWNLSAALAAGQE